MPIIQSIVTARKMMIGFTRAFLLTGFPPSYIVDSFASGLTGNFAKSRTTAMMMKKPGRQFPVGMILLVIMVVATAILGTIALNSFYDGQDLSSDFLTNGQFDAFVKLGNYYGCGNALMIFYAISNALAMFAAIIISIDAPLRILLGNADKKYIPQ